MLLGAIAVVTERARTLAKALVIPTVVYLLLANVATTAQEPSLLSFIVALITILLHTVIAVTTHRIVILGPEAMGEWGLNRWTMRETRFAMFLMIMGIAVGFILLFGLAAQPYSLAIAIPGALLFITFFSLVFPAAAIDETIDITAAWRLAKGHLLPLFLCVCIFPMLLTIPLVLIQMIPGVSFISPIFDVAINVLTIAALSIIYTEIRRLEG